MVLDLPQATAEFFPQFWPTEEADRLFADLTANVAWKQEQLKFFGKSVDQPRLTAWYGDPGMEYTYSGLHLVPLPWTDTLAAIETAIETATGTSYNSVLLNLYRDNRDTVGWHADDEHGLGPDPVIASASFGATRTFKFKHQREKGLQRQIDLTHGSLLLMGAGCQVHWLHSIPRTATPIGPRINLTFRRILIA